MTESDSERLSRLEDRLTRFEVQQANNLERLKSLVDEFKEHRDEDHKAQTRIGDAIERVKLDMARYNQRLVERDRVQGILLVVAVPIIVTVLNLVAKYLIS